MYNPIEPTPEREKEVIKEAAKFIVNNNLTGLAEPFLRSFRPTSEILGGVAFLQYFHWSVLLGRWTMELTYMMADKPRETIDHILAEVEVLEKERQSHGKPEKKEPSLSLSYWWKLILGR